MRVPASAWSYNVALNESLVSQSQQEQIVLAEGTFSFLKETVEHGYRVRLTFSPNGKQLIRNCHLAIPVSTSPEDWLLCNGFQSWTETYWRRPGDQIPQLRKIARPLMGYYGDYHIDWIPRKKGCLHSWSWTERRQAGQPMELIASLNENIAFTCFQWRSQEGQLSVEIDCRNWEVDEPVTLADFVVLEGTVDQVYDEWTNLMQLPPLRAKIARGWTSWYQHYTEVSENIVAENLSAFKRKGKPLDFFQIDDGYQKAVGDWLSIDASFPAGMKNLANSIRASGPEPGLWLAPCIADRRSKLLAQHPEWVQKDHRGRPLKAGYNPLWKGWFYALNTEHEGWQEHLQQVFTTVVEKWGYGMLKLDFLYAACIFPQAQWTRAQLMRRTLENIRRWSGDAYLLGCGTPLASGFGIFDYCRIGADIHLRWEHRMLRWFRHRERVSTLVALRSVLGRWPLAGRVWRNDPDVYLLRDENMHLSEQERRLVHRLNTTLGELLFTSDNPDTYGRFQSTEEEWQRTHWQTKDWQVHPAEGGIFALSNAEKNYQVELGKTTGRWSEK